MSKSDIKIFLIITFIIVEILSLIFNSTFVTVSLYQRSFNVNFSVIFFCIGFFIIDLINDFYSFEEAEKFFFYKLFTFVLFTMLGKVAVSFSELNNTWIATALDESPKMIIDGMIASFLGYKVMNHLMQKINFIYLGKSIFLRYFLSTIPGEIVFSLTFTLLNFSKNRELYEVIHIFSVSMIIKIFLSLIFSLLITIILKTKLLYTRTASFNPKIKKIIAISEENYE